MGGHTPLSALYRLFPHQISNDNVSVAISRLVVVSENVRTIAVTENVVIYEEEGARLWIGYPFDVGNILEDRNLQTLVGRSEFDMSHANLILRPSHDRWLASRFEV